MRLQQLAVLIQSAPGYREFVPGRADLHQVEITDLVHDSTDAVEGCLFFCRRGGIRDGHDFAQDAVAAGARALVCERRLGQVEVPVFIVDDARKTMNFVASPFFGDPSSSMRVVGVTGTNGKTTTSFMLHSVFRATGDPSGLIGTIESRVGNERAPGVHTTPESADVQRLLRRMVEAGATTCAMEVTSHGIDQGRIDGTRIDLAVFTNLSQDHLDYHGSLESYFETKLALFQGPWAERGLVNVDDEWGQEIVSRGRIPMRRYSVEGDADYRAEEIMAGPSGSSFRAVGPALDVAIAAPIPGMFNVSNALAAASAAAEVGVAPADIVVGLRNLRAVPGRLEPIDEGQPFAVLVDYAHTPAGVANVLTAARGLTSGKVIVVLGCGGDRDRSKRPLMGEAAAENADVVFLTSDNPRSEDPMVILAEMEKGLVSASVPYYVEPDRRSAIRVALGEARPADVVVIAGRGHESHQEVGGERIPFDDRVVAAELLRELP
jgi:UDP-N-acetylmuramoyl-L-alanyl-D-glutamate--2,6-diaminopimelate ligase